MTTAFIREAREQPGAVSATLRDLHGPIGELVARLPSELDRVLLAGCGDPYFAGRAAIHAFENWAGLPAEAIDALEFRMWRSGLVDNRTLVIVISQSGKTIQAVESARLAAERGAAVVCVTNTAKSPLAELSDHVLPTSGGPSYSFPTRTTTVAMAALGLLAVELGAARGLLSVQQVGRVRRTLTDQLPAAMETALSMEAELAGLAGEWAAHRHFAFIGSGPGYAAALIGAAKVNETSRLSAEADELEEYAHLDVFGIQPGTPLLFVLPTERVVDRARPMIEFATGRGHPVAVFTPETISESWVAAAAHSYRLPSIDEVLSSALYALPLQLFAHGLALAVGRNPDRPDGFDNALIQRMVYTDLLEGWHEEQP